jgi:hypothetical protein
LDHPVDNTFWDGEIFDEGFYLTWYTGYVSLFHKLDDFLPEDNLLINSQGGLGAP